MTTIQERLGPAIDPLQGAVPTADGRDWAPIPVTDAGAWAGAVVRAKIWQFKGQWRYDLSKGIDYERQILGVVPDLRVVQEIYRKEIGSVLPLDTLTVTADGEEIRVAFRGPPGSGISGELSFFEQPEQTAPTIQHYERSPSGATLWFTEPLDPWSVPDPADFEIDAGLITGVSIHGEQVRLVVTWTDDPDTSVLRYLPGLKPLRSKKRVNVEAFRVLVNRFGLVLLSAEGDYLTTEGGFRLSL